VSELAIETKYIRCKVCGEEYPAGIRLACEECFGPVGLAYDYDAIREKLTKDLIKKRNNNFWRYAELLPVNEPVDGFDPTIGFTPIRRCRNLEERLDLKELFVKDETVNPTYSFKDRSATIGVLKSKEWKLPAVGCASTGNLATATAAAAAKAELPCYIFVPASLSGPKIVVSQAYGAKIIGIEGSYDDANRIANLVADKFGYGLVNINVRPYYIEGSKTIGLEILEQFDWTSPDHILIPLGSGALLSAVYKAYREFETIGFTDISGARISGSQPENCSPIATAFSTGSNEIIPVESPEIYAESLAIGDPASGLEALKIIRETGGFADATTDNEILNGQYLLAKTEGIFAEPAGGTVVASLIRRLESGDIDKDERILLLITGSGLKTINTFVPEEASFPKVPSNLEAVERFLEVT